VVASTGSALGVVPAASEFSDQPQAPPPTNHDERIADICTLCSLLGRGVGAGSQFPHMGEKL